MIDFNQTLTPGDIKNGIVNVVVEIPTGGIEKIEWNRTKKIMEVDRLESTTFLEPTNYGFVPQTIGEDGDGLDVLIVSETTFSTGATFLARIIGVMKFNDEDLTDDKIVVIPINNQTETYDVKSLADLPKQKIDQITYYFSHYKDQIAPNLTVINGWGDIAEAKSIIYKSIKRWNNTKAN